MNDVASVTSSRYHEISGHALWEQSAGPNIQPADKRKQSKKFHHKVQTGCLVCRRRRVKCDETKPTCRRCQKISSQCAWPTKDPDKTLDEKKYYQSYVYLLHDLDLYQKVQHRKATAGTHANFHLPKSIDLHQGTSQDRRCLDYYLSNITTLLPTDSATRQQRNLREVCLSIVPQFAQHSSAVRHAISAEAFADESHMRHANTSTSLQQQRDRHHRATIHELLRTDLFIEEILICCVLMFSYSCFVRDPDAALVHVQSGLKMIEEQQLKGKVTESRLSIIATAKGALECLLASFPSIFPDHLSVANAVDASPEPFESIEAAHDELRSIIGVLATKKNLEKLGNRLRIWNARFQASPSIPQTAQTDAISLLHQTTQLTLRLLTTKGDSFVAETRLVAITKQLTLMFSQKPVVVMTDAIRLRDIVRESTTNLRNVEQ